MKNKRKLFGFRVLKDRDRAHSSNSCASDVWGCNLFKLLCKGHLLITIHSQN